MPSRAASRRAGAGTATAEYDDGSSDADESEETQMTESSPLKQPPPTSTEAQGGTARDRLAARARRRGNGTARDVETELSTPPRTPAPVPEAASDEDEERDDEDAAGGREGGSPSAALTPVGKGRSPGRFRGLLKGRKRAAPAEGGEEEGGESGEEEGGVAEESDGAEAGTLRRDRERKEARREAPGSRQVERTGPHLTAPAAHCEAQTAVLYRPRLSYGARTERKRLQQQTEAREEGFFVRPLPHASGRSLQLLELRLGAHAAPTGGEGGEGVEAGGAGGAGAGAVRVPRATTREPDPVRRVWVRPAHVAHVAQRTSLLSLQRGRAAMGVGVSDAAARVPPARHTLQLSVGGLQLHDHPLFLREHALQRQLRGMAEQLAALRSKEVPPQRVQHAWRTALHAWCTARRRCMCMHTHSAWRIARRRPCTRIVRSALQGGVRVAAPCLPARQPVHLRRSSC